MSVEVISFENGGRVDLNNKLCTDLLCIKSWCTWIGWMVLARSFHRWENPPSCGYCRWLIWISLSLSFTGKWVDRATLCLWDSKCASSWLVVGVSLGSMTDVMNSCDSAVGDYNVSGASEEQNISLQVGFHSFGSPLRFI